MNLLAIGLNHRSAPLALRGRFAFSLPDLSAPRGQAARAPLPGHPEVLLLSTCNRFELYCAGEGTGEDEALGWLSAMGGVTRAELRRHAYLLRGSEVARHAFRVASGLDSLVLGETQILGQMKRAVRDAAEARCIGPMLNQLFQRAFAAAKKARSATGIGAGVVSVASTAACLIAERVGATAPRIALAGAGDTIERVAAHLHKRLPGAIAAVCNRGAERGARLARRHGVQYLQLPELGRRMHEFDVVVACTGSREPVIGASEVARAAARRAGRPLLLVDLAVPRNVDPAADPIPGARVVTLEDLERFAGAGNRRRQAEAARAEALLEADVRAYEEWLARRETVPLIRALQARADDWRATELARAHRRLRRGEPAADVLESLCAGLTRKMLHGAVSGLQRSGGERDVVARAVTDLFLRCPVRHPAQAALRAAA